MAPDGAPAPVTSRPRRRAGTGPPSGTPVYTAPVGRLRAGALTGIWTSIALTVALGALGPSVLAPTLPGASPVPLGPGLPPYPAIALAAAAILTGGAGLALGLRALRAGWTPGGRWPLPAGAAVVAVVALLPPIGSADHLNYAAYGRLLALGYDPYLTTPAELPHDPVAGAVEEWRTVPSVYGPVATAVHGLAGALGDGSVRRTVLLLALVNAAAFLATALLLHRCTRGDPARRGRAALLWTLNPLMIYHLAAGMHVDTLAVACMVAALALGTGRPVRSGALLGLGVAVKVNAGLVALGPAWELRRCPRRLAVVTAAAVAACGLAYLWAGPHALDRVSAASRAVSLATPWHLVKSGLQAVFGPGGYRVWIQLGALALLAVLAVLLARALREPYRLAGPGAAPGVAVCLVTAWLLATPYALPWYDGLVFALLALVGGTALDGFLVARLTVLSLGYLPAREAGRPAELDWLVEAVRARAVPWALLALTAALAWWAYRAGARARTRPRSAVPLP